MPKRPTTLAEIPKSVPVFPLSGALLLPFAQRPLNIFEPRYIEMIDNGENSPSLENHSTRGTCTVTVRPF